VELSIDTASSLASIALSKRGKVVAANAWECKRNHTQELLPAIDKLLVDSGVAKGDLEAVFVSTGPGMYTGLRVGVSIGKGLAAALGLPMVGVGRLALDAYPHRSEGSVVAVHQAGRGDLAWALYRGEEMEEVMAPRLSRAEDMVAAVDGDVTFVGEIDDELREAAGAKLGGGALFYVEAVGRAPALAEMGWARLEAGGGEEAALLAPVYLRPPAIGPQSA
jgi:tRNA threonylcarbamoyladenosine biosynthesis protein TsaB